MFFGLVALIANGQQPDKKAVVEKVPKVTAANPISFWIAKKLDYSKSILKFLTKADFDKVATEAEEAVMAFNQLTTSCGACHSLLRVGVQCVPKANTGMEA